MMSSSNSRLSNSSGNWKSVSRTTSHLKNRVSTSVSNARRSCPDLAAGDMPENCGIDEEQDYMRVAVGKVMYGSGMEVFISLILGFNFAVMVIDTDLRAAGEGTPFWADVAGDVCSLIYLIEFLARFFVERRNVLRNPWNRIDFVVLLLSGMEKLISIMTNLNADSLMMVRVFRIVRLFRLVRAVKLMRALRELRKLIQMMLMCFKTLFWSFVLTFILMTMWSVIFVELIAPIVAKLEAQHGTWGGDTDWTQSYTSVMRTNLTLFQTIVAGDSWGKVPVPVMKDSPWTAFLFLPAQVTLVFGVLNLILAVIVDSFAESRANDHAARTAELESEEKLEKSALGKIFDRIDEDRSGGVTLEELQEGAINDTEFRQRLRVMDVSKTDLQQLFTILDEDGSGDVDPDEFIDTLYRMKCADSKSATMLVKHTTNEMLKRQDRMEAHMADLMERVRAPHLASQSRRIASICPLGELPQSFTRVESPGVAPSELPLCRSADDNPGYCDGTGSATYAWTSPRNSEWGKSTCPSRAESPLDYKLDRNADLPKRRLSALSAFGGEPPVGDLSLGIQSRLEDLSEKQQDSPRRRRSVVAFAVQPPVEDYSEKQMIQGNSALVGSQPLLEDQSEKQEDSPKRRQSLLAFGNQTAHLRHNSPAGIYFETDADSNSAPLSPKGPRRSLLAFGSNSQPPIENHLEIQPVDCNSQKRSVRVSPRQSYREHPVSQTAVRPLQLPTPSIADAPRLPSDDGGPLGVGCPVGVGCPSSDDAPLATSPSPRSPRLPSDDGGPLGVGWFDWGPDDQKRDNIQDEMSKPTSGDEQANGLHHEGQPPMSMSTRAFLVTSGANRTAKRTLLLCSDKVML